MSDPIPDMNDSKWACGDIFNTFSLKFINSVDVPIKLYYVKVVDRWMARQRMKEPRGPVHVDPESFAVLTDLCIGQTLEFLVLAETSTTDPLKAFYDDWPKVPTTLIPDGIYFSMPASSVTASVAIDTPPFSYSAELTNKPTPGTRVSTGSQPPTAPGGTDNPSVLTFTRSVLCGRWFTSCPNLMDQKTSACTGFWKFQGPCTRWCEDNPVQCDQMKTAACNPVLARGEVEAATMLTSPECGCILRDASQATTPGTIGLTYEEFMQLLNRQPDILTKLPKPECYFPMCVEPGALLTTEMQKTKCPQTIQACILLAKELNMNRVKNFEWDFVNQCSQIVNGTYVPGTSNLAPSPSPAPGPEPEPGPGHSPAPGPGHSPAPAPGPGPSPAPGPVPSKPWTKTAAFYIVIAVAVVLVVLGLGLGLGLGLKKGPGRKLV
jgi:hypothetical protein